MDLNDYLTEEEREQMEGLVRKAAERRQQDKGKTDDEVTFLLMQVQNKRGKQTEGEAAERGKDFDVDLNSVTEQLCRFCQKYKLCDSRRKCGEYMGDDEELPFD